MSAATQGRPRLVVVGGGVAGLSAARAALERMPELDVRVLECAPRLGGLIDTESTQQGFLIEHGADCIVTAKPAAVATVQQVGLGESLSPPAAAAATTFIARGARLLPLPAGLGFGAPASVRDVLCSRALSPAAKARMALEPWLAPQASDVDESVAAFVGRRFGTGFLEQVLAPVLESVYGAPASELSARACLPRLRELEQRAGSVLRGLGRARTGQAQKAPVLTLRDGMGSLVHALVRSLPPRIHTGVEVIRIEHGPNKTFRVLTRDAGLLESDALILAAPAHVAAALSERLSPSLAGLLASVRHGRLDCLSLAWRRSDVPHPLQGSGFVVARCQGRLTRACTWSSSKWAGRAPQGFVLIRGVLDGAGATDDELIGAAREELTELLGVTAAPSLLRLRRRRHGLPIHDVGCVERALSMHEHAGMLGAFALAGSAHGAMGVSDCIESGRRAAQTALCALSGERGSRSARPIVEAADGVRSSRSHGR